MTEFWEESFIDNQMMWGLEPTDSAIMTKDFFVEKNVKNVLIPGIGYGRNAKVFLDNGMNVTGIEISKTAIDLARENGLGLNIHHGSVTDMPFDENKYDGIFCFALIHLLDSKERKKLIEDCYNQLKPNGYMVFTAISKNAPMYGKGRELSKNRYETMNGVNIFFYDELSVKEEFEKYGLVDISVIKEPDKDNENKPPLEFTVITCKKE
ncbi:class I SAM-dependent methyltransferase [Sutcliffiella rhizosphaerae]|uniref:Methyltransferase type 11 domain-containing protein n=1 Tax=Sutcliffiella rhizosphaerae TaxID=2880967 RepID=A0ABN8A977_9BACI|nr:class I SAM-dependent methyltransferase [Sutcliffiella rhizosphaerae]CAG9620376.1 hypothetical protein BACCIP111883_01144 [Sutcliffiella rhizosphaerae]